MANGLCVTCDKSIWCPIWTEMKCLAQKKRVYDYAEITSCKDYKKRSKDFKDRKCQCEDCLKHDMLEEFDA